MFIQQILLDPTETVRNISESISYVKDLGFPFILGIFYDMNREDLDAVMMEAYKQEVAGYGKHVWFFAGNEVENNVLGRSFRKGSELQLAYKGSGFLGVGGEYTKQYEQFQSSLKEMKESPKILEFVKSILPNHERETPDGESLHSDQREVTNNYFSINSTALMHDVTFLNTSTIDHRAQFLYEATILLGLTACSSVSSDLSLDGNTFYQKLLETSFQGISGTVELDPITGSRIPNSTYYLMFNLVEQGGGNDGSSALTAFEKKLTDIFASGQWEAVTPFVFNNNATAFADEEVWLKNVEVQELHTAVRVICLLLCGTAIALGLVCAFWTLKNREKRIVKASQPFFLCLICIGTIILASSIIPASFDLDNLHLEGNNKACMAVVWLLYIGIGVIFSALLAKTYRINKIMKNAKKFKRITMKTRQTLFPVIAVLLLNIIVLSLFTVLDPMQFRFYVTAEDRFSRPSSIYWRCEVEGHGEWMIPLTVLNFGILILSLVQAWQVRFLSTEFQETQSIYRVLSTMILVAFITVPVIILAQDNPDSKLFLTSATIFATCCSVQLLIFVPKYRYEKEQENKAATGQVRISGLELQRDSTDASPSLDGEAILSEKSPQELVAELEKLQRQVQELQEILPSTADVQFQSNSKGAKLSG
mmetsp:Transcript_7702/g.13558  ORF Transcript_7702/g.13558 Transcript_7702/m.13558 type:complete len:650 (+) Transcript_7702:302-2251(+)